MANPKLPPPPLDTSLAGGDGRAAPPWARWLQLLQNIVGTVAAPVHFCARNTVNQSVANNTLTTVTFGNQQLDSHDAFDGSAFTCPGGHGGVYRFSTAVLFDPGASIELHRIHILKNGTGDSYGSDVQDIITNWRELHADGLIQLAAGDTVSVVALQTNGASAARNIQGDGNHTYFMGWRIA